jgi:hypothetical protein
MTEYFHRAEVEVTVKARIKSLMVTAEHEMAALFSAQKFMEWYIKQGAGKKMAEALQKAIQDAGGMGRVEYEGMTYEVVGIEKTDLELSKKEPAAKEERTERVEAIGRELPLSDDSGGTPRIIY